MPEVSKFSINNTPITPITPLNKIPPSSKTAYSSAPYYQSWLFNNKYTLMINFQEFIECLSGVISHLRFYDVVSSAIYTNNETKKLLKDKKLDNAYIEDKSIIDLFINRVSNNGLHAHVLDYDAHSKMSIESICHGIDNSNDFYRERFSVKLTNSYRKNLFDLCAQEMSNFSRKK